MNVVQATISDIPWIAEQLTIFTGSLDYKNSYLPRPDRMTGLLYSFIERHVLLLAKDGGETKGMICGEYFPHPFNPEITTLYEHFWWVPQEHRRSGAGGALLQEFLDHARRNEAVARVSLEYNSPVPEGYLERFGLRLAEKTYIMES